ncbi:MAG: hypothetical protein ACJ8AG_03870, partial [Ktedonobacteraceae bacterium]
AAELAYRFIDSSFRSTDSRELDEEGGLPGVTREYRRTITTGKDGEIDYANAGIEGYGWGALSVHLLLCHVLGLLARDARSMEVAPVLPQALRRVGASYRVGPIAWGSYLLHVTCVVRDDAHYTMQVRCTRAARSEEEFPQQMEEQVWNWEGAWGDKRLLQLP